MFNFILSNGRCKIVDKLGMVCLSPGARVAYPVTVYCKMRLPGSFPRDDRAAALSLKR